MTTLKGTTNTKEGKPVRRSHVPVPETRQNTSRGRLGSKDKDKTNQNDKTVHSSQGTNEDQQKHGRLKDPPRILVKQGSKKELVEENTRLQGDIHSQGEKIKQMEAALNLEKENIQRKKSEAEEKENIQSGHLESMKHKCNLAEHKLSEYKTRVLQSNIDPVILSQIDITAENEDNIYLKQTRAKEEVAGLRGNLKSLSTLASEQLECLKTMGAELDSIIDT